MSDSYISICTINEVNEPTILSEILTNWLKENEIIESQLTHCVSDIDEMGYKPGKEVAKAIGDGEIIPDLNLCGMEIKTERQVFEAGAFTGLFEVWCPKCKKNRFEGFNEIAFIQDALTDEQMQTFYAVYQQFDKWHEREAAGLTCPHCKEYSDLDSYRFGDTIALSNLGFIFWNWPQLTSEFITQVKEILGREIKIIIGHI